jgi:hypothetical protein
MSPVVEHSYNGEKRERSSLMLLYEVENSLNVLDPKVQLEVFTDIDSYCVQHTSETII